MNSTVWDWSHVKIDRLKYSARLWWSWNASHSENKRLELEGLWPHYRALSYDNIDQVANQTNQELLSLCQWILDSFEDLGLPQAKILFWSTGWKWATIGSDNTYRVLKALWWACHGAILLCWLSNHTLWPIQHRSPLPDYACILRISIKMFFLDLSSLLNFAIYSPWQINLLQNFKLFHFFIILKTVIDCFLHLIFEYIIARK